MGIGMHEEPLVKIHCLAGIAKWGDGVGVVPPPGERQRTTTGGEQSEPLFFGFNHD